MLKRFLDRDTRGWIECKHTVQQVESVWVGIREQALEGDLGHVWKISDIFLGPRRSNAGEGLFVGSSQVVQDLVELVNIITTLEKWATSKQFRKDTTNTPDVD